MGTGPSRVISARLSVGQSDQHDADLYLFKKKLTHVLGQSYYNYDGRMHKDKEVNIAPPGPGRLRLSVPVGSVDRPLCINNRLARLYNNNNSIKL